VLAATEQALTGLVSPAVERYIHEHHLYRPH
jgi:nicotinate-nucleotide adenylyltransferase